MITWHRADMLNRMFCNLTDGKKIAMPRYYKNKLYDDDERTLINAAAGKRFLEQQAKDIEACGSAEQYEREQQLAAMQAFKIMYKKSSLNCKL